MSEDQRKYGFISGEIAGAFSAIVDGYRALRKHKHQRELTKVVDMAFQLGMLRAKVLFDLQNNLRRIDSLQSDQNYVPLALNLPILVSDLISRIELIQERLDESVNVKASVILNGKLLCSRTHNFYRTTYLTLKGDHSINENELRAIAKGIEESIISWIAFLKELEAEAGMPPELIRRW